MKRAHFEALQPICPVCNTAAPPGSDGWRLAIARVDRVQNGPGRKQDVKKDRKDGGKLDGESDVKKGAPRHTEDIVEGVLHCTNSTCRREYPIIDGIPVIIAPLRAYIADNLLAIYRRGDLSESTESLVGDCCGVGSAFDTMRQHLSSYAWDHYGDLDPEEVEQTEGESRPGSCLRMLESGLEVAGPLPIGPILDIGCSAGRTMLDLAARTGQLVLGVDLHYPSLCLASEVVRRGIVRYPRRRVGLVYDRREFPADLPGRENADTWVCDATNLPFARHTFTACIGLNMVDSVRSPVDLFADTARVLAPGGVAMMSCPYDWSPAVTPVQAWIGGHSQRGHDRGSSAHVVRQLLTDGALPSSISGLELEAEIDNVPWHVRMHERSIVSYKSHLVVARTQTADHPASKNRIQQ
ncbi:MAG: methyltransferase domain-containing protein [Proteobacteria bacterium]|nr:methyltransferase domain-containing protein [Pseudomonadota bacterium]